MSFFVFFSQTLIQSEEQAWELRVTLNSLQNEVNPQQIKNDLSEFFKISPEDIHIREVDQELEPSNTISCDFDKSTLTSPISCAVISQVLQQISIFAKKGLFNKIALTLEEKQPLKTN